MFIPKYTITNQILLNITRINSLVKDINGRKFPTIISAEFERAAREVSAHSSTSIEGNPLPLTEVKKILKSSPPNARDSEKEILNYNHALENLDKLLQNDNLELSLKLILDIHKQVTDKLLPKYESGKLRKNPVVVNDPRSGKVVYLPPDVDKVSDLLISLIEFINKNYQRIDPLILAGIFHKEMVIIHPFIDGNGRTTRLITKVLLAKMGLNTFKLFSFENYYNQNVTKYFETVGEYGDYNEIANSIDFTNWLEYFTGGLIDELLRVDKILPRNGDTPQTKLSHYHLKLISFVKKNGFISDTGYAKLTNRAKSTRTKDFQKLIDMNLIVRVGGGRSTHYILKN